MTGQTAASDRLLGGQLAWIAPSGRQSSSKDLAKTIVALASRQNSTAC